jgi:AraC family transcriptional regulator of arabinose operon
MEDSAQYHDHFARFFCMAEEWDYAPGHSFSHKTGFPHYLLGCLLEGESTLTIGTKVFRQQAISLNLLPPNTPYRIECVDSHRELWMLFEARPTWQRYLNWGLASTLPAPTPFIQVPKSADGTHILDDLRQTLNDLKKPGRHSERLAELSFERALIHISELEHRTIQSDDRLTHVIDQMRREVDRPWRADELAAAANLSLSGFTHLFTKTMGMPPKQFLEQIRMEQAKSMLLTTHHSIKHIASSVGYRDPLHFSTRFRHLTGCAPRLYRETRSAPLLL